MDSSFFSKVELGSECFGMVEVLQVQPIASTHALTYMYASTIGSELSVTHVAIGWS